MTASARVSPGILCVASDRKCSRLADQDEWVWFFSVEYSHNKAIVVFQIQRERGCLCYTHLEFVHACVLWCIPSSHWFQASDLMLTLMLTFRLCRLWPQVPRFHWVSCASLLIADAHAQTIRMSRCMFRFKHSHDKTMVSFKKKVVSCFTHPENLAYISGVALGRNVAVL